MNIRQLSNLLPTDDDDMDIDVKALLAEKKAPPLHIIIRRRVGANDIERAFFLFSNYERNAWYDDATDEYHIEIIYYHFQYESEILPRILSLGAAAEVISPPSVREEIITIANEAIKINSQFFER